MADPTAAQDCDYPDLLRAFNTLFRALHGEVGADTEKAILIAATLEFNEIVIPASSTSSTTNVTSVSRDNAPKPDHNLDTRAATSADIATDTSAKTVTSAHPKWDPDTTAMLQRATDTVARGLRHFEEHLTVPTPPALAPSSMPLPSTSQPIQSANQIQQGRPQCDQLQQSNAPSQPQDIAAPMKSFAFRLHYLDANLALEDAQAHEARLSALIAMDLGGLAVVQGGGSREGDEIGDTDDVEDERAMTMARLERDRERREIVRDLIRVAGGTSTLDAAERRGEVEEAAAVAAGVLERHEEEGPELGFGLWEWWEAENESESDGLDGVEGLSEFDEGQESLGFENGGDEEEEGGQGGVSVRGESVDDDRGGAKGEPGSAGCDSGHGGKSNSGSIGDGETLSAVADGTSHGTAAKVGGEGGKHARATQVENAHYEGQADLERDVQGELAGSDAGSPTAADAVKEDAIVASDANGPGHRLMAVSGGARGIAAGMESVVNRMLGLGLVKDQARDRDGEVESSDVD